MIKKMLPPVLMAGAIMIISPGFQCGDRGITECSSYGQDTVKLSFGIVNNSGPYNVNDTVHFFSVINDSIHTVKGRSFTNSLNALSANIQLYKVVFTNNSPELNYANIEFNPLLSEGYFQNYPGSGFNFLYNRIAPDNRLRGGLVAGRPGLYVGVILPINTYYINDPHDYCTSYSSNFFIPVLDQQKQHWAALGTSLLRLAGSNGYQVISTEAGNYFFIEVQP